MAAGFAQARIRVEAEHCWLLHSYPYRETSLILEVFSLRYGRVAMVARGARRPASQLRGNLLTFQPLLLSWYGAGELKTLHSAEWQGGTRQLTGVSLMCGFYLNELLLKLLPREDACSELFYSYQHAIASLASLPPHHSLDMERALRRFEISLLRELGFGLDWMRDANGDDVVSNRYYRFEVNVGFVPVEQHLRGDDFCIPGGSLLAIAVYDFHSSAIINQAKWLVRQVLLSLLGDTELYTRQLLKDLQSLQL